MESNNKKKITANLIWRFGERVCAQGVAFVVSIILARLLDPEVHGTIALVTVFITILEVFMTHGIGTALVQKKDATNTDFSTAFYFNVVFSWILYGVLFLCAPGIASFYHRPELTSIVRVLSIVLVVAAVKNIQHAYVARHMMFHKFFFATLGGTIGAAVIGIWMAYKGYGVWALVTQSLFNHTVDTIILWFTVRWRPTKEFSFQSLKQLYSYGWKLLVSELINKTYTELRALIIGKKYTSSDLAFYNKGEQFPKLIVRNVNSSIDSILLPTMSRAQDDKNKVRLMTSRAIKTSTFVMMPLMVGLAVCAEPLVRLILTEKWIPCVPFLRIYCFVFAFYPIHTANLNAIKAVGRSDYFLKLEIIKKIIGLIALLITMNISVEAMAYSLLVTTVLAQIINSWPNRKLLNYKYERQIMDILPQVLLSCFTGAVVYSVFFLHLGDILSLIIQIPLGIIIYITCAKLFRFDSFDYLISIIKSFLITRKKQKSKRE